MFVDRGEPRALALGGRLLPRAILFRTLESGPAEVVCTLTLSA